MNKQKTSRNNGLMNYFVVKIKGKDDFGRKIILKTALVHIPDGFNFSVSDFPPETRQLIVNEGMLYCITHTYYIRVYSYDVNVNHFLRI